VIVKGDGKVALNERGTVILIYVVSIGRDEEEKRQEKVPVMDEKRAGTHMENAPEGHQAP